MINTSNIILDASALIALITKENGWEKVLGVLPKAVMSSINLSEVGKILIEKHGMKRVILEPLIERLVDAIIPFDKEQAYVAAELTIVTKQYGLSFGDRACFALAIIYNYKILTADRIWKDAKVEGVEVELIR